MDDKRKDCPMRHECGNCLPAGGFCTAVNDPICEALHNAFNHGEHSMADHLIANGVTVQQWIPVSERLPEEWEDVLVRTKYDFCEVAVYMGIPGKWRITWNHDLFEVDSITHWMPLPQPPKEG